MNEPRLLSPQREDEGIRMDVYISDECGISRSHAQRLIRDGFVTASGKPVKVGEKLRAGTEITAMIPEPTRIVPEPQDIPLDIVYEDADIIVINKPQGMVVHPAAGNLDNTLVNALLYHCHDLSGINGVIRPGIVHRLDKDTSGLLVAAKNDDAHRSLAAQIADKTCHRTYMAVLSGVVKSDSGSVDQPIGRHPVRRKKMAVVPDGRRAVTHYTVLERYPRNTLVECRLETGRTHQIRVHMAYIGHPCMGDKVYGPDKQRLGLDKQVLHACKLSFVHPKTGQRVEFASPLPEYFELLLDKLRKEK